MAHSYWIILCAAAVLGILISGAWSLDCYQCNSYMDIRCSTTPLPDSFKKTCEEGKDKLCRKIQHTMEFERYDIKHTRTIRSCGWDDSSFLNSCHMQSGYGSKQVTCSCVGQNCNSATVPLVATTVLLGALALLRIW